MYKVSIIIPVYNQEDLVIKALDTIPIRDDIEVIVCDDCSTDNTYKNLELYNRIPIKLFRNETNRGSGYSRNICLDAATGEYIFGLDSDDELITDKWSEVVDKYLSDNYDMVRILRLENDNKIYNAGCATHCYFLKKSAIGNIRFKEVRLADDGYFFEELTKKDISVYYSNVIAYKYNYPRVGSLDGERTHS